MERMHSYADAVVKEEVFGERWVRMRWNYLQMFIKPFYLSSMIVVAFWMTGL
jgi:hypothetical protein